MAHANQLLRVETDGVDLDARLVVLATGYDREPDLPDWPVAHVKAGRIEIVAAVEGFDGPNVLLADGTCIQPDV